MQPSELGLFWGAEFKNRWFTWALFLHSKPRFDTKTSSAPFKQTQQIICLINYFEIHNRVFHFGTIFFNLIYQYISITLKVPMLSKGAKASYFNL